MSKNCPVMQRIKSNYEQRQCYYLTRRTPVIIRLDGKTFHSYCKPLKDRFDVSFMEVMNLTAIKLAESIQGAQCLFLQSDEISILLHDYKELTFAKGHNWNDLPTSWKRGRCVIKTNVVVNGVERSKWVVDNDIPEFTQDVNYIEQYLKTNY